MIKCLIETLRATLTSSNRNLKGHGLAPHLCRIEPHICQCDAGSWLVLRGVCEGQVHLQLVLDRGVVRAYLTPDSFTVPRSDWVQLMLACDQRKVCCAMCILFTTANSDKR